MEFSVLALVLFSTNLFFFPECFVAKGQGVKCGAVGISATDCSRLGCCRDPTNGCYYPMDECTADQQFVFEIRDNPPSISVDPTKLVIPGYPDCKPVFVNNKVAIFKFGFKECGVRVYNISGTVIYMAEVLMADGLSLNMVQELTHSDSNYSSYYPSFSLPLQVLLGTPLYLEVLLHCSRPEAVLLVNYCIAYPRSAKKVLVYEGCANPFDSMTILRVNDTNQNRQQRRFEVRAFQFMDIKSQKHLDEEIYFMCSTEVCIPGEKTCEERCFDGRVSLLYGQQPGPGHPSQHPGQQQRFCHMAIKFKKYLNKLSCVT
ncbi:zona pellucida sperm-binding protein 4-like [Nelusetta ayraudi]|uniref:zona pellucida sperm-binding protein 4-like n=1 Tax=Nelusetta ayraudi TaxID=303726 RepID=UPI003F7296B8